MLWLPAFSVGSSRWVLPLADRSAAALIEAVLDGGAGSPAAPSLVEQISVDPPLVLWAWMAAARDGVPLTSLAGVAEWLAAHVLRALQWAEPRAAGTEVVVQERGNGFADQVGRDIELAGLAALLGASAGEESAECAYLAGMFRHWRAWGPLAAESLEATDRAGLDSFFPSVEPSAACWVERAMAILGGESCEDVDASDVQACRDRALEARRLWLEPHLGIARCLPLLMERLGRLDRLETQFQQVLETEKLEAMAEFAAGAGHEINNPLAIITGRAQLFLRDETDPERRRELATINTQVRRAHEMIADMRLFARPPRPERQRFDLVRLVDQVIAEATPLAAERAVSLRREGVVGPVELDADPAQLAVALHAMCRNSVEAIGFEGKVRIQIAQLSQEVRIQVMDNGPGIPPEHRRHLFDPFYSSRQAGRGLGLGLSKCWRIVTGHGGRIEVESQPGQGATFALFLPQPSPAR